MFTTTLTSDLPTFFDRERARKIKLLRLFCQFEVGSSLFAFLSTVLTVPLTGKFDTISAGLLVVIIGTAGAAWWLVNRDRFEIATVIFTRGLALATIGMSFIYPTDFPLMILLLLPLFISLALEPIKRTLVLMGAGLTILSGLLVAEDVLKIYKPLIPQNTDQLTIGKFFILLMVIPILLVVIYFPMRQKEKLLIEQNEQLNQVLQALQDRQQAGREINQKVLDLSAQLMATAGQQSSGSQEQAASLAQVTVSVVELSQAASQIAAIAEEVSTSTVSMVTASNRIEQVVGQTAAHSQEGLEAIQRTIQVSQEVAKLYNEIRENLKRLNEKNASTRRILEIIHSIAQETHLLSLNASIEAAGVGQYGERFGVIAQEVKSLANRSNLSSQEVVGVLVEIEAAANEAAKSVEDGYHKALEMETVAGNAGKVIQGMRGVSDQALLEVSSIHHLATETREKSETIKIATGQQNSASQQVLEAISGVSIISQQTATASVNLSTTAHNLEEMASVLNKRLTN